MACFTATVAEAVVTTIVEKAVKNHEMTNNANDTKVKFSDKIGWLNRMLWGGSALLAFEHVWHGEVTPWFPFLTGAATPESTAEMLHEIATSGVAMALLVTAVWAGIVAVSVSVEKKTASEKN